MKPTMKPWPKLSAIAGPRDLECCQVCGGAEDLARWQEHDDDDMPRPVVVVLCVACSDRLVEPHPRLYRKLHDWEPLPGSMPLCRDCTHRSGVSCTSQQAGINGGPGLKIIFPRPIVAHVDGRDRNGRRFGRTERLWQGPVESCSGRTTR